MESPGFQFLNIALGPAPQSRGLALLVLQLLNSALVGLSVLSQAFVSLTLFDMEVLDASLLYLACLLVHALLGLPCSGHAFQSLEVLDLGPGPTAMGWALQGLSSLGLLALCPRPLGVLAAFPAAYLVQSC